MKKLSKVLLIWAGLELAALPFALPALANLSQTLSTPPKADIRAVPMPSGEGEQVFLIAANAQFAVISEDAAAKLTLNLTQSGNEHGVDFGRRSNFSGPTTSCSAPVNAGATRIFTAQPTSRSRRASLQDRAVRLVVQYDSHVAPKISVISMDAASEQNIPLAFPCGKTARLIRRNQA